MSPRAMLAGPLKVLVGTPMPDRSKVRGQTKSNLPALQVWGFCIGLTTLSCKKLLLREQQRVTYKNHESVQNDPPESMPWATVNAESENTRNSAGNRIQMTDSGQSRKEAAVMTTGAVSAKTTTLIGFWNVQTMYEQGRLAQVIAEMKRYKLDILGVSESRWTKSARMKTTTGETVLYSGREDDLHHEGVAIIMKKGMEKYLMEWKPVNSRIIQARLKGRQTNLSIIQCYAPTNDSNDRDKEAFYEQLQATFENVHGRDLLLVMGDVNAKVGSDNLNFERVMKREGCGVQNDNGERLVEWCAFNNIIIGGTLFPHHNIHKLTWTSPNGRDQNQVDHLMVNSMWRRSLLDVRVRRGADASSDHHVVTAKVRLKLRAAGSNKQRVPRYDISRLQDQRTKNAFVLQLRNRFQALSNILMKRKTL